MYSALVGLPGHLKIILWTPIGAVVVTMMAVAGKTSGPNIGSGPLRDIKIPMF